MAILEWRNTPQADGYSPAQKMMGRNLRGLWPAPIDQLKVQGVDSAKVSDQIEERKIKSKFYHDRKSQTLPALVRGQDVYVQLRPEATPRWTKRRVADVLSDRDYNIEVNGSIYRRNRVHIRQSDGMTLSAREEHTEDNYLSFDEQNLPAVTSTPKANVSTKAEPRGSRESSDHRNSSTTITGTSTSTPESTAFGDRPQRHVRKPLRF